MWMLSTLKVPECRRIIYFSRFEQHPTTAHLQNPPFSVSEGVQILPSVGGSRFGVWQPGFIICIPNTFCPRNIKVNFLCSDMGKRSG